MGDVVDLREFKRRREAKLYVGSGPLPRFWAEIADSVVAPTIGSLSVTAAPPGVEVVSPNLRIVRDDQLRLLR